jgi:crossover junction endodeoxyribonuclease RusA
VQKSIAFDVIGCPVAQGSKAYFVNKHTGRAQGRETAKGLPAWRSDVRWTALANMNGAPGITGPVAVAISFFFQRPRKHYGTGKKAAVLRADAPKYHTTTPDVDKLSRAALDALTSVCFADDSCVARLFAEKRYADADKKTGATITVSALE